MQSMKYCLLKKPYTASKTRQYALNYSTFRKSNSRAAINYVLSMNSPWKSKKTKKSHSFLARIDIRSNNNKSKFI